MECQHFPNTENTDFQPTEFRIANQNQLFPCKDQVLQTIKMIIPTPIPSPTPAPLVISKKTVQENYCKQILIRYREQAIQPEPECQMAESPFIYIGQKTKEWLLWHVLA